MKHVCITDIHGYLDQALEALEKLEEETDLELLNNQKWSSDHKLILNGDMFDRGPQNREALEWAFENADLYILGNHEFFAMFPDVLRNFMSDRYFEQSGEKGLYWLNMDEEMRHRILEKVAKGEIVAAYQGPKYIYSHSGSDEGPNVEELNRKLRRVGRKLVKAHEKTMDEGKSEEFAEVQKEIVEVVETENGSEILSSYPSLFDVNRNSEGRISTGGLVWHRFFNLNTDVPQVVGHTKGSDMVAKDFDWNPQWRGPALNINTIRDAVRGDSSIALSVEDEDSLEVFKFHPQ